MSLWAHPCPVVPWCLCQRVWALLRRLDLLSVLQALYARASIGASLGEFTVIGGFVVGMICTRKEVQMMHLLKCITAHWDCGTIQTSGCRLPMSPVVQVSPDAPHHSSVERLSSVVIAFGGSCASPLCVLFFHNIRTTCGCAVSMVSSSGVWSW